jgi:N-sulfoglucosamine sulfohydrolase
MRLNSIYVLGLMILIALTQCKKSQNTENKPNFIVFIADDVSWDDLSVYGNEYVKTPNIESLSSEGLVFKNMYLTTSSCSPSRNSIITGRYSHNTGAPELHSQPPLEMTTVVEALKEGGYYTALSGKFHMGDYARRGFDLINEDKKINGPGGEEQWVKTLEDRPKDQPFFMWYASYDAHRSWGENDFSGTHDPEALTPPEYLVNDYPTKLDLVNYYDEIRRFDHSIGEVVATLKKQTVYENTFIIVMSDNGRPFPHSKTRLNDQGVKTPFILTYKKDKISGESQSLISAIDIAPTILEYAKLEIGENYQGKSFKKVLENPDTPFRNYVFAEHNWHDYEAHERMVRSKDFMYIENNRNEFAQRGPLDAINSDSYASLLAQLQMGEISEIQKEIFLSPRPKREFYDMEKDVFQRENLIEEKSYQEAIQHLQSILEKWKIETGDSQPDEITKDWYKKRPGPDKAPNSLKTIHHGNRGEFPGASKNATQINNKGPF